MSKIKDVDPEIHKAINGEDLRQEEWMELIASENYQSPAVLAAQSSHFANKYSEGFPWRRYYGGQEFTDQIESLAIERAKKIFRADHANVQALSGAAANICIYAALLEPWDIILGMDLSHWWHLTHGSPVTFISKIFNFVRYKTKKTGEIDFIEIKKLAHKYKPKMILAWFSAYPRSLDYDKFREIAEEVWAILFADMSHIWWFIAANLLDNPLDHWFHVMMTTTHKSLRWPRWSLILSKWTVSNPLKKPENTIENIPTRIDRAVFPWVQWWPHMNSICAIAVALHEASSEDFKTYAKQTLENAKIMAQEFTKLWYKLVTWGTDNHMIVIDFSQTELDGRQVEKILDKIWISTSKSTIPDDPNPPFKPSWLRIGMPAMTTRWVKELDTIKIINFIDSAIKNKDDNEKLLSIRQEVKYFCKHFPVPGL